MASGSSSGGYSHGGHRAEAERWLNIAQKLLIARDLHGTKTFAIRARDSDPSFEPAHQIVAVVDTLLAAESGLATPSHPFDWYSILQLPRLCPSVELAATQYRKLALLLTPERNRLPFADHAFRLVCEAWSVLSNPAKKAFYDGELQLNQFSQHHQQQQQQQQQHQHRVIAPAAVPAVVVAQPAPPPPPAPQPAQPPPPQPTTTTTTTTTSSSAVPTASPATPVRRIPRANDDGREVEEERIRPTSNQQNEVTRSASTRARTESQVPSFWTACPYCYILYEYPKVYEECSLRCQNCKRAFQAVMIPSPPVTARSDSAYFCCWGFFPLGFSGNVKDMNSSNWRPFSPMFVCPGGNGGKPKKGNNASKTSVATPRVYYDDDVFIEISDPSDDSDDDEWEKVERKKKKAKRVKESLHRNVGSDEALLNRTVVLALGNKETNQRGLVGNSGRKQMAKGMKDLGKLDLNVEFSNEVEEPARGVSEGNGHGGEEDTIFFEGLDEFLSSLPILNVVGDDKVKAS